MPAPVIALATSLPEAELPPGEHLLAEALERAGARAQHAIWSAPEIDWTQFSAVVVRTCWDYHLRATEFLAWIRALEVRRISVMNHPDLIRWNTDKSYLTNFAVAGISVPETVWLGLNESVDVAEVCWKRGWPDAVLKPIISASAYGTERRNSGSAAGPLMVQRYLPAIETEGEWSLIYFDHQFSHAVRKRPRPEDFRVQKDHGGSVEPAMPSADLKTFAEEALRVLPQPATIARVDVVDQDGRPYLMEMEVIEPELFLEHAPGSARRLVRAILKLSP